MNAALYLLNALAMVAVVSFHFFAGAPDVSVNIDVDHWVKRPIAQRAGMHEHQLGTLASSHSGQDMVEGPSQRLDRYTF
ncbi:hypothetical protein [Pseudomonas massiliensis]|uniref:hypothetical protein n=1 Tax=Pseudomonas massiliensis TaxID=522492 RepID=UPI0005906301|nr:hypothetical protein [Pseudomonas massiliensis]